MARRRHKSSSYCHAIVELHGGSVCVEDSSEAGTTIAVQLPVQ